MMRSHTPQRLLKARFRDALASLPTPGGNGYHPRLLGVANIGIALGFRPDEVIAAISAHTPTGGRRVPNREIEQAVAKAVRDVQPIQRPHPGRRWRNPRPQPKPFDAGAFMERLQTEADGIGEADVWEASPIRIDWPPEHDAVELLARLYLPDDVLFVGERFDVTVRPMAEWLSMFRDGGSVPPHVIPNPLTGTEAPTKDGKQSFRADACVRSFRFCVAEFDHLSRDEQLRFWWSINLPVVALIDSGGKSVHAWVRIDDGTDADSWSRMVEQELFGRYLVPLGCDAACRNEARLSRMPGHHRAERGRWQRILYLCPEGRRVNSCKH